MIGIGGLRRGVGWASGSRDIQTAGWIPELSFEDPRSLPLERERTEREQRRHARLKGHARPHLDATVEDLDHKVPRGRDRSLIVRLAPGSGSGTDRPSNIAAMRGSR